MEQNTSNINNALNQALLNVQVGLTNNPNNTKTKLKEFKTINEMFASRLARSTMRNPDEFIYIMHKKYIEDQNQRKLQYKM